MSKVVVITGATSGIGFAAVKEFARMGMAVIGVGRSDQSCKTALAEIGRESDNEDIIYIPADLSSQKQVRNAAGEITSIVDNRYNGTIDVLINNAGTFSGWYRVTEDGYELQFAVNYLSHFLLTNMLLPKLGISVDIGETGKPGIAATGRIITISSGSHYHTRMNWKDIMNRKHYNCLTAYKQSKLADVLFTYALNRRFSDSHNIRAYVVDPGLVNTAIGEKRTGGLVKWFWGMRRKHGIQPEEAAKTIIYLASENNLIQEDAVYWKECTPKEPSKYSQDRDAALKLWRVSERLCGIHEQGTNDIHQKVENGKPEQNTDTGLQKTERSEPEQMDSRRLITISRGEAV